jgi:hypothetical protein
MTTVGYMPDLTWKVMTVGSGHNSSFLGVKWGI